MDRTEAGIVKSPNSNECPEQVDWNRSEPQSTKHAVNPLKQIIEKIETKNLRNKLPDSGIAVFPIPLQWVEATKEGVVCAEILCSAELIQVN